MRFVLLFAVFLCLLLGIRLPIPAAVAVSREVAAWVDPALREVERALRPALVVDRCGGRDDR